MRSPAILASAIPISSGCSGRETGNPPMAALKLARMRLAEYLLLNTELSVKAVAWEAGVADLSHFTRDFKRLHGVTPLGYRRPRARAHTSESGRPGLRPGGGSRCRQ
ncbi:MAG: helix-turn-helix transcriptional regulator [Acidobacteriia bacterium]|nr:helix-turn-helix transcriptional regulator [Terriglobia bacterium]